MLVQKARIAVTSLIFAALSLSGAFAAVAAELRIGLAADVTSIDPHFLNVAPNNAITVSLRISSVEIVR